MGLMKQVQEAAGHQLVRMGQRLFPPQKSMSKGELLLQGLTSGGNTGTFTSINEYFEEYRTDYARRAYESLTPSACHQLAMSNSWVSSAIYAITKPIASSKLIASPNDKDDQNTVAMDYMNMLMQKPNQRRNSYTFKQQFWEDLEQTGEVFTEVAYHPHYDVPTALYRVPPYKIKEEVIGGEVRYVRTDTGYVFENDELLVTMNPNPFNEYRGLSKLVPLYAKLMVDAGLDEHNARFFVNDVLKGIISLSDKIDPKSIDNEIERAEVKIKDMVEKGEAGHLLMYGATFQQLSINNKDMLTDKVEQSVVDAVCAVYRVPPHKIMRIESGNLGGGTGETQDESMNETLMNEADLGLATFNDDFLTSFCGITDTTYSFVNLTRTDERKQQEIQRMRLEDGVISIDEERERLGRDVWDMDYTKEPTIQANRIPISKAGDLTFMSGNTPAPSSGRGHEERDKLILSAAERWDSRFKQFGKELG